MDYEQHAFISYAHLDDTALSPDRKGWVTRFHATLEALLSMRLGRPARIWRDDKLRGNDAFPAEILDQFRRTAMLISVLTPRYVMSDWCVRELRAFCEQAQAAGGLRLDNRCRVFKVMKAPLDDDAPLPEVMKDMLGYAFFVVEDGAPMELDAAYGDSFAQDYNRRVSKLAWDVAQLLKQLESAAPASVASARGLTVYLAECGHDCRPARERVETELKCHGHRVLPDQPLPCDDADTCERRVDAWLAQSDLSIHLIGGSAGAVPDGVSGEPLVVLQNRLAAQRSASSGLERLIWLPAQARSPQPAHQAYLERLRGDALLQRGADLLSSGIDDFVQTMHAALDRLAQPAPVPVPVTSGPVAAELPHAEPAPAASGTPPADDAMRSDPPPDPPRPGAVTPTLSIYFLCVGADRKPSLPLRRWLRDHGIDVELPAFEGSAAAVRASNRRLLAVCDAVLVYYGAGDEAWKRGVDSELKKNLGIAGSGQAIGEALYLAGPTSGDKDDLVEMQEPNLVDGRGDVLPDAELTALLGRLRAARRRA